jgi:four helix bundle protein
MITHKNLEVWVKSIDFVIEIYRETKNFPKDELFGLSSQMRRSAISVPSYIAEGAARKSTAEFIRSLYISLGSLSELETQIIIAQKLKYIIKGNIANECSRIGKMLINLIRYLKSK